MSDQASVFVVDDDREVRDALRLLLESVGLRVECFESSQAYLKQFNPEKPGCLVLDVRMPGMSGLDLQEHLFERNIQIPVVIITGHGDVPMAVRAMKSGAIDFIEKPFNDEVLLDAIRRAIARGEQQRSHHSEHLQIQERLSHLTPREHEVMQMVTEGRSNKEIANTLGVSAKTIEAHRARVMEKMQAGSLAELVRMVLAVNGHD